MTVENMMDLEWNGQIAQEALRIDQPAPNSSTYWLSEDTQIGKVTFKAHTLIQVNFTGLHHHSKYWQRPAEFLPERFDNSNILSEPPEGKKRHPFAWCPFNGGQRICFGKTFAEFNLKLLSTYIT